MNLTPIGTLSNMKDGAAIIRLRGTIKQVWKREAKETKPNDQGQTRKYNLQALLIEDTSTKATTVLRLFGHAEVGVDMVGQVITVTAKNADQNPSGVSKSSYKDNDGKTWTNVAVSSDAKVLIGGPQQSPPASASRSAQPAATPASGNGKLRALGDLFVACLNEAHRVRQASPFPIDDKAAKEMGTTFFIECCRRGIDATPSRSQRGETPSHSNGPSDAAKQPRADEPVPVMAARIASGDVSSLATMNLDVQAEVFDCLAKMELDAKNCLPVDIDAAISRIRKATGCGPDKVSEYALRSWSKFLATIESCKKQRETEAGAAEAPVIETEIVDGDEPLNMEDEPEL